MTTRPIGTMTYVISGTVKGTPEGLRVDELSVGTLLEGAVVINDVV